VCYLSKFDKYTKYKICNSDARWTISFSLTMCNLDYTKIICY
jgi:hypothetical protein